MGHRYLKVVMDFFGIESFESIIIEGQMKFPEQATQIKDKAIQQAKRWPNKFDPKHSKALNLIKAFKFLQAFLFYTSSYTDSSSSYIL